MIESFWGRMQTELLDRKKWVTILKLSAAMADYIDSSITTNGAIPRWIC